MNYQRKLQQILLQIPQGKVSTYREIGIALGTRGYRYVGQLLKKNPEPDKYPCYKVVCSDGRPGGYALGYHEKIRRLKEDGILIRGERVADFDARLHRFSSL